MATLIKERRVVTESWQRLEAAPWLQVGESGLVPDFPHRADLLVPLKLWQLRREDLLARAGRNGVRLEAHEDPAALAADLDSLDLVEVNFPGFGDGRGYSTARLLRERYGYAGELRATGAVARDHLYFMAQCGFDAFVLREGEDPAEALAAFGDFTEAYQGSVARPLPLFRRRAA
jgi:uncharacterized protein (DUF934 family)